MRTLALITLCTVVALPVGAPAAQSAHGGVVGGHAKHDRSGGAHHEPDGDRDHSDGGDTQSYSSNEAATTPENPDWPPPPLDRTAIGAEAVRLLAEPTYRFCHDPRYPLRPDEARWCRAAVAARCPELPAACALYRGEEPETQWLASGWLSSLAAFVFWGFILMLVGGLAFLVARLVAAGGFLFARRDVEPAADGRPAETVIVASAEGPERDVARLLAAADRLAAAGDHARAIDLVYAALLRHLEGRGLVRVRRDCTNGDYVRALRKSPELQALLRDVVGAVERVQFGAEPPSPDRYAGLLGRVTALLARPLALLALLGLALGAGGCRGGRGPIDDAPAGRSALRRLFAQHGGKLTHRLASLDKLDTSTRGLLVTVPLDQAQLAEVNDWADKGGVAILTSSDSHSDLGRTLHPAGHDTFTVPPFWRPPLGDLHAVSPSGSCFRVVGGEQVLLGDRDCAAVVSRGMKRGDLIFVADGALFTNGALTAGDNGTLALELLRLADDKEVELVDETTGMAATSPAGALLAGGLGALMLQMGLVALLLFAHRGIAFGQRQDPPLRQRREFAEHVRAVGMQYWKARAYRHALALWGGWALERLRQRAGVTAGEPARLAQALAARSGEPEPAIAALIAAVQRARSDAPGAAGNERAIMAELHRLLHTVGGLK